MTNSSNKSLIGTSNSDSQSEADSLKKEWRTPRVDDLSNLVESRHHIHPNVNIETLNVS
jgi:hypothetical protein